MFDPFAAALAAQFRAPGSAAAAYTGSDGIPRPIRVIVSQPDDQVTFGKGRIVEGSLSIEIQRSDVASPQAADVIELVDATVVVDGVAETSFRVYGAPTIDVEGLTWTCGAVLAA